MLTCTSVEGKHYAQHRTRLCGSREFRKLQRASIFGAQKLDCEKLQCSHKLPYDYNTVSGGVVISWSSRIRANK